MRECGDCTKCCEGWLADQVRGKAFYPGINCHYLSTCGKGCTIYEDRPKTPCRDYECQWKKDPEIPEWMKPNAINAIISPKRENGHDYLEVVEAGEKLRSEVLNWMIFNLIIKGRNVRYQVSGGWNHLGSMEFVKTFINQKYIQTQTQTQESKNDKQNTFRTTLRSS